VAKTQKAKPKSKENLNQQSTSTAQNNCDIFPLILWTTINAQMPSTAEQKENSPANY